MILLLQLILITSIWVLGLTIVTQKGMILERVGAWAAWQGKWTEPVISCVWCMSSIHSIIGYALALGMGLIQEFSWALVIIYPLVAMGSSMVSGLVWTWYMKVHAETEYYIIAKGDAKESLIEKAVPEYEEEENYSCKNKKHA